MDIGTFTSNGTDNMYIGLKNEASQANPSFPASDKHDAVINWGDNAGGNPLNGPDKLRFIFTESASSQVSTPPANQADGLEIARMVPNKASTLPIPNYGMMGIGNFYNGGIPPVDAKLDIDGDLRIRQVTQNNALTQVLVIDPTDLNRVHWMDASNLGGNGIGNYCGATQNPLTYNYEVPLNNYDYHFTGIDSSKAVNNVGIGTECFNPLPGKLTVNQRTNENGTTGIYVINRDNSGQGNGVGGVGSSIAIYAKTNKFAAPGDCKNIAGWFESQDANLALVVPGASGTISFGFINKDLTSPPNEPNVCGAVQSNAMLEVNGSIFTPLVTYPSDINFKTNIVPITSALDKVKSLNGVYYDYQTANYPEINFSNDRQVGVIAQNIDTVLTEVTHYDSILGAYTVDYARINALLIEAIKEQDVKVDSLATLSTKQDSNNNYLLSRLMALEQCMNEANICNTNAKVINENDNGNGGQTIELSNLNAIILDQNSPNPFAENTTISYVIPDDVMDAQLLFYDMNGRIIKQVTINERGQSKLTVYGENLQKGIYTYSLIADGKLIATKKMVKQ